MNQENKTPHNFCETPEEKCTMNYCDENGCQNRERHLVSENKQLPTASQSLCKWNFKLVHGDMVKCIEEHTGLHTASLREELEKLRAENERLKQRGDKFYNDLKLVANRNKKLRNALEYAIKALSVVTSSVIQKSILPELKEALKGGDNNGV